MRPVAEIEALGVPVLEDAAQVAGSRSRWAFAAVDRVAPDVAVRILDARMARRGRA